MSNRHALGAHIICRDGDEWYLRIEYSRDPDAAFAAIALPDSTVRVGRETTLAEQIAKIQEGCRDVRARYPNASRD